MVKVVFIAICFVFWAAPFVAGEEETVASNAPTKKHGVHIDPVQLGRTQYNPRQQFPPRRNTQNQQLVRTLTRLLFYQYFLKYIQSLKATTAAPPPAEPDTTAAPPADVTTPDPCPSWPKIGTCNYQIFKEKLTWTAAKAKCPSMCNSVLAHKGIRSDAEADALLVALAFPAAGKAWVDLLDSDSIGGNVDPVWNGIDLASQAFANPGDYGGVQSGTAACGFIAPGLANKFQFDVCTSTPATTPEYYVCEVCTS